MKKLLLKEKLTQEQEELEVLSTKVLEVKVKEEEAKVKAKGVKVKDKEEEHLAVDQGEAHQFHLVQEEALEESEGTKDQQATEDHLLLAQEGLQLLLGEAHHLLVQEEVLEALEGHLAGLLLQEAQEDLHQVFLEEALLGLQGVVHLEDQEVGHLVAPEGDLLVEIEDHQVKAIVEAALKVGILPPLDQALTDHLEEVLREIIMMDHLEAQTVSMIMMVVLLLLILVMVPQEVGERDFLEQEAFHLLGNIPEMHVNLTLLKLNLKMIQQMKKNNRNSDSHLKVEQPIYRICLTP